MVAYINQNLGRVYFQKVYPRIAMNCAFSHDTEFSGNLFSFIHQSRMVCRYARAYLRITLKSCAAYHYSPLNLPHSREILTINGTYSRLRTVRRDLETSLTKIEPGSFSLVKAVLKLSNENIEIKASRSASWLALQVCDKKGFQPHFEKTCG